MDFQITSAPSPDGGSVCVTVAGEIDLLAAPALREELARVIGVGTPVVVVDLTAATFFDSTALGILVGANKRARQAAEALVLVCANPAILAIFEITLLDRIFDVYETVEAATEAQHST